MPCALRLERLTHLTALDISGCHVTHLPDTFEAPHGLLAALRRFSSLHSLNISENSLFRHPASIRFLMPALADCKQLRALDLTNTPFMSEMMRGPDGEYPALTVLTSLTCLKLSHGVSPGAVLEGGSSVSAWRAVSEHLKKVRYQT